MEQNLLAILKDRQINHKCLICGRKIDSEEDLYYSVYHYELGDVLIHREHYKDL